ncbi:MAG TPA: hypothetical protein VGR28_14290 [Candidatus Thermoplasmatota archaeon]|jgi:hypothetical protein|nr:hypothetical protein [Candidatus Thermoplasmatota archaeon]
MAAGRAASRPLLRAGAGFALAGVVNLVFVPLFLLSVGFSVFGAAIVLAGVGMLLAGAGLARGRVGGVAAAGFVVAAAGAAVAFLADLGAADLFKVGHAILALGLVEAAWYALRGASDPAALGAALGGLAIASKVCAAGIVVYIVLLLGNGFLEGLPLEVVALAGFLLADRAFAEARRALPPPGPPAMAPRQA